MTETNSKVIAPAMQSKTEIFIQKAIAVHGNKYDYSLVEYLHSKLKVKIVCCKHGVFEQTPNMHLRGRGCIECGKITRAKSSTRSVESVVMQFATVHGEKYGYDKVFEDYKNTESKVRIKCKKHGYFLQTPHSHLSGCGCKTCGNNAMVNLNDNNKIAASDYFNKANEVHGGAYDYDYDSYMGQRKKITITCREHGKFEQTAYCHLKGSGCPGCKGGIRYTKQEFIKKANKVHNFVYDYTKTKYRGNKERVAISCELHGVFYQMPYDHIAGCGCPSCGKDLLYNHTRSRYVGIASRYGGASSLYIIECHSNRERFYKVGITVKDVKKRFSAKKHMPYEFRVVKTIKAEAGFIFDLEHTIHRLLKGHKYQPEITFGGQKECFSYIPSEVLRLLSGLENSDQLQLIA